MSLEKRYLFSSSTTSVGTDIITQICFLKSCWRAPIYPKIECQHISLLTGVGHEYTEAGNEKLLNQKLWWV